MCTTRIRCGIVQDIIYSHFKNSNCDVIMQVHSFMLKMLFHILQRITITVLSKREQLCKYNLPNTV